MTSRRFSAHVISLEELDSLLEFSAPPDVNELSLSTGDGNRFCLYQEPVETTCTLKILFA